MDALFYELARANPSESWHLAVRGDARGKKGLYQWRDLTWARRVDAVPPFQIVIERAGQRFDITIDIVAGAPVLSARAAHVAQLLAKEEIELIPARINGGADEYFVMNVLSTVRCVDEKRTQIVEKWTEDSYRPDRAGEYKVLRGIVIDPEPAIGHNIFRIAGSYSANIIVSHVVKEAFEREGLTGVHFVNASSAKESLE